MAEHDVSAPGCHDNNGEFSADHELDGDSKKTTLEPEIEASKSESSTAEQKVSTSNVEGATQEINISKSETEIFTSEAKKYNTEPIVPKSETEVFKSKAKVAHSGAEASKSDEFLLETKYMMLNFMNLLPPVLYTDHLIQSPASVSSDLSMSDQFWKGPACKLSKSTSYDVSNIPTRPPKLKYLSKQSAFRSLAESEDNVNYRYKQNLQNEDSIQSLPLTPDSPTQFTKPDFAKAASLSSVNSPLPISPVSPRKSPHMLYRLNSDISSSGDYNYNWDADDEYEVSNASSLQSIGSVSFQNGFLNLRQSSPWTPALSMQSDLDYKLSEDVEANGERSTAVDDINLLVDDQLLDMETHEAAMDVHQEYSEHADSTQQNGSSELACALECGRDRSKADRSKLKLDIPAYSMQLDDTLGSLKTELDCQMTDIESQFEEGMLSSRGESNSPPLLCLLTAHTTVARMLARMGDEVMAEHELQVLPIMERLGTLVRNTDHLTYGDYWAACQTAVEGFMSTGWKQVALLMVIGQRAAWHAFQQCRKQFGNVVNYASQLVADVAADFIIQQGGWRAVMNFDLSQSSDTRSSTSADNCSPGMLDYFTGQNVTQVDRGAHTDHNQNSPNPDNCSITSPITNDACSKPSLGFDVNEGPHSESDKSDHGYTNTSSISLNSPNSDSLSLDEKLDISVMFGKAQCSSMGLENISEHSMPNQSSASLPSPDSLSIFQVDHRPSLGFDVTQGSNSELGALSELRYSISGVSEGEDNVVFDDVYTKDEDFQAACDSVPVLTDYGETDVDNIPVGLANGESNIDVTDQTVTDFNGYNSQLTQKQSVRETCVDLNVEQNAMQLNCNCAVSDSTNSVPADSTDTFDNASNNAINIDPNNLGLIVPQYMSPAGGIIHSYSKTETVAATQMTDDDKTAISESDGRDTNTTIMEKYNNTDDEKKSEYNYVNDSKETGTVNAHQFRTESKRVSDEAVKKEINSASKCKTNELTSVSELGKYESNVDTGEFTAEDEHGNVLEESHTGNGHETVVNEQGGCNVLAEVHPINTSDNASQETGDSIDTAGDAGGDEVFEQIRRMGIRVVALTLGVLIVGIALKVVFTNRSG